MGQAFRLGLALANDTNEKENEIVTVPQSKQICIREESTYAFAAISHVGIPLLILKAGNQQGLISNLYTISVVQKNCFSTFSPFIDQTFVNKNHLGVSKRDLIDQGLFLGAMHLSSKTLSMLTCHTIDVPIQVALGIISTFTPIEDAFLESNVIKQVSETTHEIAKSTKDIVKKPIKRLIKNLLIAQLKDKALTHVDSIGNNVEGLLPAIDLPFSSGINNFITSIGRTIVDKEITEKLGSAVATQIDVASDALAGMTVDISVKIGINSAKGYLLNKALTAAYSSNPVLTATSLIIEGGVEQDLKELSRRVLGVAAFVLTGSAFWPLVIINVPPAIEYVMSLRNHHIKKQGLKRDPAIEVIKQTIQP